MDIFVSILVLLSPLWFALVLVSGFSTRTKVAVSVVSLLVLISLPLLFIIFGNRFGF